MIELPEALTLAKEINSSVTGKAVRAVLPPTKKHKFCWFSGDPSGYDERLRGKTVVFAEGFGMFLDITFSEKAFLCIDDGVNIRLINEKEAPRDYQLMIAFTDGTALVFTVAMYGGIVLHGDDYDSEYYIKSRAYHSPFSEDFGSHFQRMLKSSSPKLSLKAFLATEQRFPGLGNGVLQDILFEAKINPRRKLGSLTKEEADVLLSSVISVLKEMTDAGGRDTEKNLYGGCGGYITKMSKLTLDAGCPVCGKSITKEAYLGGSVYYCPCCQPENK